MQLEGGFQDARKTQTWIVVSVYVLIAIVRKGVCPAD